MKKTTIPRVAIVTRTKDRGILLERAIQSVHSQSMGDFVHVIINDAGDPSVVDVLVEKYKDLIKGRVKVIHNTESSGMEAASNKAIKSVDSVYIAIHDDDDTWHPDFLKMATQHLEESGAMGVVVTTDRVDEEISQDGLSVNLIKQSRWMPDMQNISLFRQCMDNQMTPITFLYRREALGVVGYYDENLIVCGDWDFGIRFLREYEVDFLSTNHALANYHHRPKTAVGSYSSIYAGNDLHAIYVNKMLNKYLREDVKSGSFGLGYIMNNMRNQDYYANRILNNIDEKTVRLEAHVNHSVDRIEEHTKFVVYQRTSLALRAKKALKMLLQR